MRRGNQPPRSIFDVLSGSSELAMADAVVWGASVAILTMWWRSGCSELPGDDATLSMLGRCHARRWYSVREDVRRVLDEVMPQIASEYARESLIASKRSAAASVAANARHHGPKRHAVRAASAVGTLTDRGVPPVWPNPRQALGAAVEPSRGKGVASLTAEKERRPLNKTPGLLRDTKVQRPSDTAAQMDGFGFFDPLRRQGNL